MKIDLIELWMEYDLITEKTNGMEELIFINLLRASR